QSNSQRIETAAGGRHAVDGSAGGVHHRQMAVALEGQPNANVHRPDVRPTGAAAHGRRVVSESPGNSRELSGGAVCGRTGPVAAVLDGRADRGRHATLLSRGTDSVANRRRETPSERHRTNAEEASRTGQDPG